MFLKEAFCFKESSRPVREKQVLNGESLKLNRESLKLVKDEIDGMNVING